MEDHQPHPYSIFLERRGSQLRTRLGLDDLSPLDPFALAATFPDIILFDIKSVENIYQREYEDLQEQSSSWSAMAFREGDGPWLVTWNPWHHENRTRVSIAEEICHIYLKHKPTAIIRDPVLGVLKRTYDHKKEREAYGVAGSAVVPYQGLLHFLRLGFSAAEIAAQYKVSPQLVQMRLQVTKAQKLHGATYQNQIKSQPLVL